MSNLENWLEVTKGLYRYVIASNCAYEIHIMFWDTNTDILNATASLYIVGEWLNSKTNVNSIERELIIHDKTIYECLKTAVKDNEENNK